MTHEAGRYIHRAPPCLSAVAYRIFKLLLPGGSRDARILTGIDVLITVTVGSTALTLCISDRARRFGGTIHLHIQDRMLLLIFSLAYSSIMKMEVICSSRNIRMSLNYTVLNPQDQNFKECRLFTFTLDNQFRQAFIFENEQLRM
jgi:hypothetical protein